MKSNNIKVSIIIVHYNVKKELFECIQSIYKSKPKTTFEIIVVDNDEKKNIKKDLISKFPKVKYVENKNNGWGGGTNKGLKIAKGEYIYLLNPDTIFLNNALDEVYNFAKERKNLGVVSSVLFDKDKKVYPLQGTKILNPLNAIFSLSVINKLFPNNPISKKFWMKNWDKSKVKEVESPTLSAALIRKDVLDEAGGFDENFFLYYEEYDLAQRLRKKGFKNYIIPFSKVVHIWEASTIKTGRTSEFIEKSRKYYFKKYYSNLISGFVDFFLSFNKEKFIRYLLVIGIICTASYLRFDKLSKFSPFIGDQAWFYISAKDMISTGNIPLLGITSSHTWIHQGPLWTYILAPVLFLSNFNPISGVYLSSFIGVLTVLAAFIIGKKLISFRFGLLFAMLFAFSPLIVFHSRFAYHTSPIPLFVLLLVYFFTGWIKGRIIYFPWIIFTMSILYNFELATVIFWLPIILYLLYGLIKKKNFVIGLKNKKIFLYSILGFVVPMFPILIYDFQNGFPQTVVFAGWFIYKLLQIVGFFEKNKVDESSFSNASTFFFSKYSDLILPVNKLLSTTIFFASTAISIIILKNKDNFINLGPFILLTLTGLLAYCVSGVPSEAYLVMLFPGLIFIFSLLIYQLKNKYLILLIVIFITVFNISFLVSSEYLTKGIVTMSKKIDFAIQISEIVGDNNYKLEYKGPGEEFESSVMPYSYLVWWIRKDNDLHEKGTVKKILIIEDSKSVVIKEL